ncbi:MAG: hypothetical protein K6F64_09565, partial [Clostridia bacterium]|nr:hypothetical protein [Clostridia bacterium]
MKKVSVLILTFCLFVSFCSCGKNADDSDTSRFISAQSSTQSSTQSETVTYTGSSVPEVSTIDESLQTSESTTVITQTTRETTTAVTSAQNRETTTVTAKSTESTTEADISSEATLTAKPSSKSTIATTATTVSPVTVKPSVTNPVYRDNTSETVENRYFYGQLNDKSKLIYRAIHSCIKSNNTRFTIETAKDYDSDLSKANAAFYYDYPEYFFLKGGYKSLWENGTLEVNISCWSFGADASARETMTATYEKKVGEIVSEALGYSSDYEKIKFVHDMLCKTVTYATSVSNIDADIQTPSQQQVNTAYGAIINGKSVCSGYSFAFEDIMRRLGFICGYVVGTAKGSHGWNFIRSGDDYYYIDVTFDDSDETDFISYDYFCVTREEISRDHKFSSEFKYPQADSNKLNFYVKNGYVASEYNTETINKIFESQSDNKYTYIKFADKPTYSLAKSKIKEVG